MQDMNIFFGPLGVNELFLGSFEYTVLLKDQCERCRIYVKIHVCTTHLKGSTSLYISPWKVFGAGVQEDSM